MEFPIVSMNIVLPLISALFIMLFVSQSTSPHQTLFAKYVAVMSSVFSVIAAVALFLNFDASLDHMQLVERSVWHSSIGLEYHVGVDGISLLLVCLTSLLIFIAIVISLFSIKVQVKEYLACFLLLQSFLIGFFCSMNLLLFYFFFEAMLIPMFLIIGIWGGENRIYAAFKFFIYTFFGSVILLASLVVIYNFTSTFDIQALAVRLGEVNADVTKFLFIGTFIAFAIKVPVWPLHTWLPDAHVEAPTGGSIILAGVLLKVGCYAIVRISLPLFPEASKFFAPMIIYLGVIAIIYCSLVALAQKDMKSMIAYSSVAHMGFVIIGIFSFRKMGIEGAIFQMISHGVISAGLFLSVGILYERHHTKEISEYGGVAQKMPLFASFLMVYILGSIALPGTSGFIGEFFSLAGLFGSSQISCLFAASGIFLCAIYMLSLYKSLMFGEIKNKGVRSFIDLTGSEILVSLPLVFLVIYFGLFPNFILKLLNFPVSDIMLKLF